MQQKKQLQRKNKIVRTNIVQKCNTVQLVISCRTNVATNRSGCEKFGIFKVIYKQLKNTVMSVIYSCSRLLQKCCNKQVVSDICYSIGRNYFICLGSIVTQNTILKRLNTYDTLEPLSSALGCTATVWLCPIRAAVPNLFSSAYLLNQTQYPQSSNCICYCAIML